MARIRTLKPEFWADEKLSPLLPITRLVFLGLVNMADDAGRLVDNVKQLDGMIFPNTDDSCRESLDTLARLSRILRYTAASGQRIIQITGWSRHQRVDHPNKYVLPAPTPEQLAAPVVTESSRDPRESVAKVSRDVRDTTYDLRPTTYEQEEQIAAVAAPVVPVPAAAAPAALPAEGWSVVRVLAPTITAPSALPLSAADRPGSPADDRPTAPEPAPALFPSGAVPPNRKGAPKVKPAAKPRAKVAAVADAVAGGDDDAGSAPAGGKYPHYPQATCAALHTLWLERRGAIDYGRFRKETAPLFTSTTPPYTLAELTGALKLCLTVLEERATNPRDRFEWGALTPARWVERVAQWVKDFRQTQEDVEHLFRLVDGGPRSVGMVA